MKISDIIPISDLRQDAAGILKRLRTASSPIIVTQRGRAVAVIQGVEEYEKSERELELLRQLATGEREIAAGRGHSLSSVLKDADALLDE
jgi:prevent-host-death family protein